MTTKQPFQIRQGDVFVEQIEDGADVGKPVPREEGRVVLAHGEATGHAHAIKNSGAALFESPAAAGRPERILRIVARNGVLLRHEEHSKIKIDRGSYRVTRQREWTGEDERQVAD